MTKGLSSSYTIQIKSTEEINALNKNEIISADSSEMDIAHTKTAAIARYFFVINKIIYGYQQ